MIEALTKRIEGHISETNGLLHGFKFEDNAVKQVEGIKDLPKIYMVIPDLSMATHPRLIGDAGLLFKIVVSTKATAGLVAFVQNVEKVLDALETDHETGELDLTLNGTLLRPLDCQARDNFTTPDGISHNAQIPISVQPKSFTRGRRRS